MLGGSADVNLIVVNLNLETRGQKGVETNDEVWMSLEEVGDTADYTWRVNALESGLRGRRRRRRRVKEKEREGREEEGEGRGRRERGEEEGGEERGEERGRGEGGGGTREQKT